MNDPELDRLLTWWIKNRRRVAWNYGLDSMVIAEDIKKNNKVVPLKEDEVIGIVEDKTVIVKIPKKT